MKAKSVVYAVLVVAVIASMIAVWMYFKPQASVKNRQADYKLSAKQLAEAFASNEDQANALYTGKVLEVEGYLQEIIRDERSVVLMLGDVSQTNGVSCYLRADDRGEVNSLKAGNQVTVKGICSGFLLDVVVEKCILLEREE